MDREIKTGTVVSLYSGKGYGFIRENETDIYFHATALLNKAFDQIRVGDAARFIVIPGSGNRSQAGHVEIEPQDEQETKQD